MARLTDDAVSIPADPDERRKLAEFAGLTEAERQALDEWCALQAAEREAQRRRALERSADWGMP